MSLTLRSFQLRLWTVSGSRVCRELRPAGPEHSHPAVLPGGTAAMSRAVLAHRFSSCVGVAGVPGPGLVAVGNGSAGLEDPPRSSGTGSACAQHV